MKTSMKSQKSSSSTAASFHFVDHTAVSPEEKLFAEKFGQRVIGQPGAIKVAETAWGLIHNPLRDRRRPIGMFFLAGDSRTGKTYTGEVLAELLHGNPDAITRIEGGDYVEEHQALEFKGAPPTYVGYAKPDRELKADEVDPASIISRHNLNRVRIGSKVTVDIIVINEFEKAHPNFYKFWMGVFDKGGARLGNGEWVDFTNAIFILTSNIGTDELERRRNYTAMGFGAGRGQEKTPLSVEETESIVLKKLTEAFRPEFRNRIDLVVVFRPHTEAALKGIVAAELKRVQERIAAQMPPGKDFLLQIESSAGERLLKLTRQNVAELKRLTTSELTAPLGRMLAVGTLKGGDIVRVDATEDGAGFRFAVASGAYGVMESERLSGLAGYGSEATAGLALQRKVRKARAEATATDTFEWTVTQKAKSARELFDKSAELLNDIEKVLELSVTFVGYTRTEPFAMTATIMATETQVEILRGLFKDITVTRSAAATQK